jgi:succinyl-CoA synthetase beta subunit
VTTVAQALTARPRLHALPPAPAIDARFANITADRLSEVASAELLAAAGVPLAASILVQDAADAAAAVAAVGGLAVCKLQSPDVLHKSDGGFVRLGVTAETAAPVVAGLLAERAGVQIEGVLIQQQIGSGVELLVGVTRERPDLPPLLTVGLGGVLAEALADTVSEALPLTAEDVTTMLSGLRGHALLAGFRGARRSDIPAAAQAIAAIGAAAESLGDRLVELEVNPLIVGAVGEGAYAVDGLARLTAIND